LKKKEVQGLELKLCTCNEVRQGDEEGTDLKVRVYFELGKRRFYVLEEGHKC
jgi:hypothetical protein